MRSRAFDDNCWTVLNSEWLLYPIAEASWVLSVCGQQQTQKIEICVGIALLYLKINVEVWLVRCDYQEVLCLIPFSHMHVHACMHVCAHTHTHTFLPFSWCITATRLPHREREQS